MKPDDHVDPPDLGQLGNLILSPNEAQFWKAAGDTWAWIRYIWTGPAPVVEMELSNVYAHERFSAQTIYQTIIESIERLRIPGVRYGPHILHEGGPLSPFRAYLTIEREFSQFLVCAAPIGASYLVTVRKIDRFPHVKWWHYLLAFWFLSSLAVAVDANLGWLGGTVVVAVLLSFLWSCSRHAARTTKTWLARHFHEIPLLGPLYLRWFRPDTFFRQDLHSAFVSLVSGTIKEAIKGLDQAQAIRPPTEQHGGPILRDLHQPPV